MTRSPRRLREQVRDTVSELPIHAARMAVMGVGRALLLTDRVRKDVREARESGLAPVLGRLKDDAGNLTGMVMDKVSSNGKAEEAPKSRAAATSDTEISVGKPKPATPPAAAKPEAKQAKPATAPPSKPAATKPAATKPAAAKPPAAKPAATKPAATKPPAAKPAASKPAPKPAAKPSPQAKPTPKTTAAAPSAKAPASAPAKSSAKPTTGQKAAAELPVSGYDEATLASVRARLRGLDARQVGELRDYERGNAARADFLRMYENRIAKLRNEP